jgi:hypothetical protein
MRRPAPRAGALGTLRDRLTARKGVEVRSLTIDRNTKQVPDDAAVVIVARPTQPFEPEAVQVLRDYARRSGTQPAAKTRGKDKDKKKDDQKSVTPGRLILLLDPVIVRQGDSQKVEKTGLEGFLGEYGVTLGNNRVLNLRTPNPLDVFAVPDPEGGALAKAFAPDPRQLTLFQFEDSRSVEPPRNPGGRHSVSSVLLALPQMGIWKETNFDIDPVDFRNRLRRNPELLKKVLSEEPISIAVAVSDAGAPPGMPRDPAHAGAMKETPRMVVFGTSGWITDDGLRGRQSTLRLDLFNSCVSWLRDTSTLGITGGEDSPGGITRKEYDLNVAPDNVTRLQWLPLLLMMLGVIALGTGVWVTGSAGASPSQPASGPFSSGPPRERTQR